MKLIQDFLTFAPPQLLRLIIKFVDDSSSDGINTMQETEPLWHGIFYSLLLFIVVSAQTLLRTHYFYRMNLLGVRIRTSIIGAVYKKTLLLSNSARKESTVGEIVNYMAVDAQRFIDIITYINIIWTAPIQIGISLYLLWNILGPSVLVGEFIN